MAVANNFLADNNKAQRPFRTHILGQVQSLYDGNDFAAAQEVRFDKSCGLRGSLR
jgi:hypothetical protein